MDLCETYAELKPQPPFGYTDTLKQLAVRDELNRRAAIADSEWPLIDSHQARVGMKECALVASWGHPQNVSHTVTKTGDSAQYEFGNCPWDMCSSKQYAYVAKGEVVGLQY